jgi:hypothetical protein
MSKLHQASTNYYFKTYTTIEKPDDPSLLLPEEGFVVLGCHGSVLVYYTHLQTRELLILKTFFVLLLSWLVGRVSDFQAAFAQ